MGKSKIILSVGVFPHPFLSFSLSPILPLLSSPSSLFLPSLSSLRFNPGIMRGHFRCIAIRQFGLYPEGNR